LVQLAIDFGVPEDAVILNAPPDAPTAGLDLDDPREIVALCERIEAVRPVVVIVDTVLMVTGRNLCRPEEAREFFGPLMELANATGVAFLLLTHLSKDKEALGRRIVEKARVVIKMTQPDPEGQPNRRKLWVDKTAVPKPMPLGISMGDVGNEYDFNPPQEPLAEPRRPGPLPLKLESCKEWLREQLALGPKRVVDLREDAKKRDFSAKSIYAA
jgi:hypothetical protein